MTDPVGEETAPAPLKPPQGVVVAAALCWLMGVLGAGVALISLVSRDVGFAALWSALAAAFLYGGRGLRRQLQAGGWAGGLAAAVTAAALVLLGPLGGLELLLPVAIAIVALVYVNWRHLRREARPLPASPGAAAPLQFLVVARAGGVLSSIGLTFLLAADHRWALRTMHYSPDFFWGGAACAFGVWLVLRYWRPASERRAGQVWRVFGRMFAGVTAFLLGTLGTVLTTADPRELGYSAAMISDLRNLVTVEEGFLSDSGRYTSDLHALSASQRYAPSRGVSIPELSLTADGWNATVRHVTGFRSCVVFVGTTPLPPATEEGRPACTRPRYPFPLGPSLLWSALVAAGVVLAGLAAFRATRHDRGPAGATA